MNLTWLPNLSRPHPDLKARQWAWGVLQRHNVREDVIRFVMPRVRWTVEDWAHTTGGGLCYWANPPKRIHIKLHGTQAEACLHEFAHAYRVALLTSHPPSWFGEHLVLAFLAEAEAAPGEYSRIRQLCRDYRYGFGEWRGMWNADAGAWNDSEIWAGLASGGMGDLSLYPPRLRRVYERFYAPSLPRAAGVVVQVG